MCMVCHEVASEYGTAAMQRNSLPRGMCRSIHMLMVIHAGEWREEKRNGCQCLASLLLDTLGCCRTRPGPDMDLTMVHQAQGPCWFVYVRELGVHPHKYLQTQ